MQQLNRAQEPSPRRICMDEGKSMASSTPFSEAKPSEKVHTDYRDL